MKLFTKDIFISDGFQGEFEGFSSNFYPYPYFTKETTDIIFNKISEIDYQKVWYIEETDTYYVCWQWFGEGCEEDITYFEGMDIEVDREIIHVYCLGEWHWWTKEDLEEEE